MRYEFKFNLGQKVIRKEDETVFGIVLQNIAQCNEEGILEQKTVRVQFDTGEILEIPENDLSVIRED